MKVVYAGHGCRPNRIVRLCGRLLSRSRFNLSYFGQPFPERAVWENQDLLNHGVWIGVGGSFDVLSGFKKRAGIFIRLSLGGCIVWLRSRRIGRFIRSNLLFGIRLLRLKRRRPG